MDLGIVFCHERNLRANIGSYVFELLLINALCESPVVVKDYPDRAHD